MGIIGKVKGFVKKVGKANPKAILTKVGKVAHSVIGTADKVLGKMEDVGNKIAKIPVIGDTLTGLYKAPVIKGVSAEMLFQGAKTGVGMAKKGEKMAMGMVNKIPEGNLESMAGKVFSNKQLTNLGNKHLHTAESAMFKNNVLSSGGRHPVIQSRIKGVLKHLESQNIMKSTPDRQIPLIVKKHMRHNVIGSLG